jgi:peptidoglycan/LPS O-acetylase OafA/YrhL
MSLPTRATTTITASRRMNARASRFPHFDSLRAIAAMSVVVTHMAFYSGMEQGNTLVGPYVARLDCGVTIFFLISGFLLYRPFVRARLSGDPQMDTKAYAWRRFLRIAPAYWVALTIIVIALNLPGVFTASGIPRFYGLAQIYNTDTIVGGISQSWSVAVEITFYAFLPLWAWLMRRFRARSESTILRQELVGLAVMFGVALVWKLGFMKYGADGGVRSTSEMLILPAQLDLFALGMLLAVLSVWYERRERMPSLLRPLDRFPALGWLVALAAFAVVSRGIGLTGRPGDAFSKAQYMERWYLYALIALGLLLPAVFGDQTRGFVRRHVLSNRVLMYIGLVSYSLFLWHQAVFIQMWDWGIQKHHIVHEYFPWVFFGIPVAIAIASLSYYLVERPALRLKDRIGRRPQYRDEALAEPAPAEPAHA